MVRRLATHCLLLLAVAGFAPSVSAAVRYVAKSGGCSHMIGKSCSAAANCGGTIATACCEIQQGHDSSLTVTGDTLEVHTGTYASTGSSVPAGQWYSNSVPFAAKITKLVTAVRAASAESPVLDLASSRQGGIWVAVAGVTVDGFSCVNQKLQDDSQRIGCVTVASSSSMGPLANVTVSHNKTTVPASTCTSCAVGFRFEGIGNSSFHHNTILGQWSTGIITMNADGGPSGAHVVISDNTFTSTRPDGVPATAIIVEHAGSSRSDVWEVMRNSATKAASDGASRLIYPRDFEASVYFYDNFADGFYKGAHFQDDQTHQNGKIYFFGNTIVNCGTGIVWQRGFRAWVKNNVFRCGTAVNYTGCTSCAQYCGSTCCPDATSCENPAYNVNSTDEFSNNNYAGGTLKTNSGGLPEPTQTGNTAAACAFDASYNLLSGAVSDGCAGKGSNNPASGGIYVCPAGAPACLTDYQGQVRENPPDIGRDEFGAAVAGCGNGVTEAGEICDDGNTVTETACPYGAATCILCNAACTAKLNLTGPYCGDGAVNGSEACDGLILNGGTCADLGCSAGGPPLCVACTLALGACSSCGGSAPKPDPPWSYDDADTLATIHYLSSNDGPVASYLSIFGDDFGAARGTGGVTVGGTTATVVSWTTRKIVVTVPSVATGSRPIAVTPDGGAASSAFPFIVNAGRVRHLDVAAAAGGNGMSATPWNSFQTANTAALPGDQIVVHGGTYARSPAGSVDSNWDASKGGSSGNSITWYANPGDLVTVDGTSVLKTGVRLSAPFVNVVGVVATGSLFQNFYTDVPATSSRVVDCEAKNGNGAVTTKGQGINLMGPASEALGNYIHDNYSHGFYVHASDLKMGYNYVDNSGCCGAPTQYGYGIQLFLSVPGPTYYRVKVFRNYVTRSNRSGIVVGQYSDSADVYENVLTGNDERGIIVNPGDLGTPPVNTSIRNNVSYRNDSDSAGFYEIDLYQGTGATVFNNAVSGPNGMIRRTGLTGTVTINSNIYDGTTSWSWNGTNYSSLASWRTGSGQDAAGQATNPLFRSVASSDFRPGTGSPMIDTGNDAQCARPMQGLHCDIGAFESPSTGTDTTPPRTPTNLHRDDRH